METERVTASTTIKAAPEFIREEPLTNSLQHLSGLVARNTAP
jgi:hypothetical protein